MKQEPEENPVLIEIDEVFTEDLGDGIYAAAAKIKVNLVEHTVVLNPETMRCDEDQFANTPLPDEYMELIDQALDDRGTSPLIDEDLVQSLVAELNSASGDEFELQHFSGEQYELRKLQGDVLLYQRQFNSLSEASRDLTAMITEHQGASLQQSHHAIRQALADDGLRNPSGNPLSASGEPADLRVPAELQQVVDQHKQHRSDSPRL